MRIIRTTMQPDVEITVSEAEYTDLSRWGVILGDEANPKPIQSSKAKATDTLEEGEQ